MQILILVFAAIFVQKMRNFRQNIQIDPENFDNLQHCMNKFMSAKLKA